MLIKVLVTLGVLTYALGLPFLEINDTHVFNLDWTPHSRIHEVWQLTTNTGIGIYSLHLIWKKNKTSLAALLGLFITGGFLFAFSIKGFYGGSMKFLDGSEKTLFDVNIGLIGFGIVFVIFLLSLFITRGKAHE